MPIARSKRVLIVCPEPWTVENMSYTKEYLAQRQVSAKTFKADEGIHLDHVIQEMRNVDAVVVVLSTDRSGWCNRNSGRLSMAANEASIAFRTLCPVSPQQAADIALSL